MNRKNITGGLLVTVDRDVFEFGVMKLPNRKQYALYYAVGGTVEILGYFTSPNKALRFQGMLNAICRIKRIPGQESA